MISCRKCKDLMIEALYGELGPADRRTFDDHLRSCPDCASEYSVMGATLRIMDQRRRPDPGREFWDGYWDRLEARLDGEATLPAGRESLAGRVGRLFALVPRWSYRLAAGATLILIGIFIGRAVFAPSKSTSRGPLNVASPGAVPVSNDPVARARDYLDRSQILLLGLVNYDPATEDLSALDMPRKKALSRDLATQAADIQNSLKDSREMRLRQLVGDLQVIMMQIANLGAGDDLDGVELVKAGVHTKGIFLKIDLTRMFLDARSPRGPGTSGPSERYKL
jgi:hypothetical protein